jgi:hypothetical protein
VHDLKALDWTLAREVNRQNKGIYITYHAAARKLVLQGEISFVDRLDDGSLESGPDGPAVVSLGLVVFKNGVGIGDIQLNEVVVLYVEADVLAALFFSDFWILSGQTEYAYPVLRHVDFLNSHFDRYIFVLFVSKDERKRCSDDLSSSFDKG